MPVATVLNRVSFFYYAKNGRLIPTAKKGKELVLISLLFSFFSSLRRGDQHGLPVFAWYLLILTDPSLQRSGTLLHWFVVVVLLLQGKTTLKT